MNRNWTELLHFLYVNDVNWHYFSKGRSAFDKTHPIVKDTSLSVSDAKSALSFLERQELIEDGGDGTLQLTHKGFEVARDEEYRRTQAGTNNRVYLLTIVLASTAILEVLSIFDFSDGVKKIVVLTLCTFVLLSWIKPDIRRYTGFESE